jgi:hypothetical protein
MHIRLLAISVFVLALPALANAQTWTSPDGFLSLAPPDANEFQAVPMPPPPFVGLWVSHDETMKFGIMKTQIPPNIKLIQSSAEEGLAEEIGGEVTRLPTKEVSGHEVWNMKAKGASVEITQAIIRHDDAIYKLMAVTLGVNPDAVAVNHFIDSLSIVQPSPTIEQSSKQSVARPVQNLGGGVDRHSLSNVIGGTGAVLGIGLLVYVLMRSKRSRKT